MINYLAVVTGGIINMIIGFLWYGPLFGKKWMKIVGMKQSDMEKTKQGMDKTYFVSFITALLMAYVTAHFVYFAGSNDFISGMSVGFWSWLGFVATTSLSGYLYTPKEKPADLYLIDNGYWLVTLMLIAGLMAVWQ